MTRLRTIRTLLAVVALLVTPLTVLSPSPASAASAGSSATASRTVTRTFLDADGKATVALQKKVSFTVSQTTNLRSLQLIDVKWSGAQPTGGLVGDQNSDAAQNEEYPFVLLECRGTDTAASPITPNTCWTQYASERFSYGYRTPPYPAWRSDSDAPAAERQAVVDSPDPAKLPAECTSDLSGARYQRWVPFDAADGTTYPGGPFGCAGLPPEAASSNLGSNLALPSNETFGVTDLKGNGETKFDVFTAEDHASLGCSASTRCSLVAVPIVGLSCDPYGTELPADQRPSTADAAVAATNCEAGPKYSPGQLLPSQGSGAQAVSGYLWWSASNWANRMSVPLTFAPADDVCSLNSSGPSVQVYGSELMIQASTQWAPHFCLNSSLFDLTHVQTPEPQARNLLGSGQIEAAYTSRPPDTPYPSPTVNAPVAVSGFGIGYSFDDDNGQPVQHLRLDARLLAKLLTESYPSETFIKTGDPGLQDNPLNITQDPEFQALNPGIPASASPAAATLLALNTDSDVMYALTSYINADPEARAWLNGAPDPWGMTVNPAYRQISLPVDNWPLLDSYEPLDEYQPGRIDCLQNAPVPYLPLVAAPTARLFSIAQDVEFSLAQSQTVCVLPSQIPGSTVGARMVAAGRQASGHHAMLGVVSLGDAQRDGLSLASLETHTDETAPAKFSDGTGRTFVAPDNASLKAATATLQPDAKAGVWPVDYDTLRASDPNAYPGTMVVYAAIPTTGLPGGDGKRFAQLLQFAAGDGQVAGDTLGRLPAGYLPMTAADGLGRFAAYTRCAAKAVAAQQGALPTLTGTCPDPTRPAGGHSGGTSDSGTGAGTTTTSGGSPRITSGGGATVSTSTAPSPSSSSTPSASPQPSSRLASASTPRVAAGVGRWVLPVLLILGVAMLLAGLIVRLGRGR